MPFRNLCCPYWIAIILHGKVLRSACYSRFLETCTTTLTLCTHLLVIASYPVMNLTCVRSTLYVARYVHYWWLLSECGCIQKLLPNNMHVHATDTYHVVRTTRRKGLLVRCHLHMLRGVRGTRNCQRMSRNLTSYTYEYYNPHKQRLLYVDVMCTCRVTP